MPPLDWDKLMAAKPTELSEEDVEEFYQSLVSVSYSPGTVIMILKIFLAFQTKTFFIWLHIGKVVVKTFKFFVLC